VSSFERNTGILRSAQNDNAHTDGIGENATNGGAKKLILKMT